MASISPSHVPRSGARAGGFQRSSFLSSSAISERQKQLADQAVLLFEPVRLPEGDQGEGRLDPVPASFTRSKPRTALWLRAMALVASALPDIGRRLARSS